MPEKNMNKLGVLLEEFDPECAFSENLRNYIATTSEILGAPLGAVGILDACGKNLTEFITFGVPVPLSKKIGLPPILGGLLGQIAIEKKTVRIRNVMDHPAYSGVPPFHPALSSFLGVPIKSGGHTYGMILLANKKDEFSEDDEKLLTYVSQQLACIVKFQECLAIETEKSLLLNTIFRYIPLAFVFVKKTGEATLVSDTMRRLIKPPSIGNFRFLEVSLKLMNISRPDGTPMKLEEIPLIRAMKGEFVEKEELTFSTITHANIPSAMSAAPVKDQKGEIIGGLVAIEDRAAEKELEKAREAFAAMIAHDLRNPIHAIALQTQMFLKKLESDPQSSMSPDSLKRILRNTDRLARLAGDFLDIARLRIGGISLKKIDLNLKSELEQLIDELKFTLENHSIELECSGHHFQAMIDPVRFHQIMTNLLTNAHKYSAKGEIIRVTLSEEKEELLICVEDKGPGIPAEDLQHIFDRFYRAAASFGKVEGSGLGLYITKGIVESHGGRIWVTSEQGVGSKFYVSFPALNELQENPGQFRRKPGETNPHPS